MKSAGKAGGTGVVDDGPGAEEDVAETGCGTGSVDGVVNGVGCDMLGGGDRTLLVGCDGS